MWRPIGDPAASGAYLVGLIASLGVGSVARGGGLGAAYLAAELQAEALGLGIGAAGLLLWRAWGWATRDTWWRLKPGSALVGLGLALGAVAYPIPTSQGGALWGAPTHLGAAAASLVVTLLWGGFKVGAGLLVSLAAVLGGLGLCWNSSQSRGQLSWSWDVIEAAPLLLLAEGALLAHGWAGGHPPTGGGVAYLALVQLSRAALLASTHHLAPAEASRGAILSCGLAPVAGAPELASLSSPAGGLRWGPLALTGGLGYWLCREAVGGWVNYRQPAAAAWPRGPRDQQRWALSTSLVLRHAPLGLWVTCALDPTWGGGTALIIAVLSLGAGARLRAAPPSTLSQPRGLGTPASPGLGC